MCPYYYSVREDGTKQDYRSVPVWSNPPYKEMQEFVGPLERARQEDATTQAILVVPRTRQKDLAPIVARNRWIRADYYHKGARDFFWRPDKTSILGPKRRLLHSTVQHILILERGTHATRTLTLSCVPWKAEAEQLEEDRLHEREGQLRSRVSSQGRRLER